MPEQPEPKIFFGLINRPMASWMYKPKRNNEEGKYLYGKPRHLTLGGVRTHLTGEYPKAFVCASGGFANLLGWDLDEHFEILSRFIVDELKKRKWERGSFATNGSSAGRGKIVTCIRPRIPQSLAYRLAHEILGAVITRAQNELLLTIDPAKFDAFPKRQSGGILRILGRNLKRGGDVELALDLELRPSNLRYVKPVSIPHTLEAVRPAPQRAQWASELANSPVTGTVKEVFKTVIRLADESLRLEGERGASNLLYEWCKTMASTAVRPSTAKMLRRRDTPENAVKWVMAHRREPKLPAVGVAAWRPLDLAEMKAPKGACTIYEALVQHVAAYRLNPHCFGIDYARLAALSRYRDKSTAAKAGLAAEDSGLLFRLHRGSKHGRAEHGLLTLWCLRGRGEALQEAVDDGMKTEMFRERIADGGWPSTRLVNGRKVCFDTPSPVAA